MIAFHHHAKKVLHHIKKHHHHYLFAGGLAGGVFVAAKIFLFFSASFVLYNGAYDLSFAQNLETGTGESVVVSPVETGNVLSGSLVASDTGNMANESPIVETGNVLSGSVATSDTGSMANENSVVETGNALSGSLSSTGVVQQTGNVDRTGSFQTPTTLQNTGIVPQNSGTSFSLCQPSQFSLSGVVSGTSFTGIIPLKWSFTGGCYFSGILSVQLYDHNNQWIDVGQLSGMSGSFLVDSAKLLSGWYFSTGLNNAGLEIVTFPGIYGGVSRDFWTGYMMRVLDSQSDLYYQSPVFTVDHRAPILSHLVMTSSGYTSGLLAIGSPLRIAFDASESLSGVRVVVASGDASLFYSSGLHYEYGIIMTGGQSAGPVVYTLSYADNVGNTGALITGISLFSFDNTYPLISGLLITGSVTTGVQISYTTSETALSTVFVAFHGASTGWVSRESSYLTTHSFTFSKLVAGASYDVGISFADAAGNITRAVLLLNVSSTGTLQSSLAAMSYGSDVQKFASETGSVATLSTGTLVTGSVLTLVKQEIIKFNTCKDRISYTPIKLQLKGNEFNLSMPNFQKNEVRKIVNAFSYYIVQKLDTSTSIQSSELDDITEKFNGFLVILKLVKDDDNTCKQNLSNYHIRQFKEAMETYGIINL